MKIFEGKKGFPIEVRIAVVEINNGYCCVESCLERVKRGEIK